MVVEFNHRGRGLATILIIILDHDNLEISPTRNHVHGFIYMVIGIIWPFLTLFRSTIEADYMNIIRVAEEKTDVNAKMVQTI